MARTMRGGWRGDRRGVARLAALGLVLGLLGLVSGSLLAFSGVSASGAARGAEPDGAGGPAPVPAALSVRVIIDFSDGAQRHYAGLGWTKGMTALDALRKASEHPRGFALEFRGSGETAFVTSIDGVANERGGRESRNWLYWVNTSFATRSAGVSEVSPGDVVLWKFERWGAATGDR